MIFFHKKKKKLIEKKQPNEASFFVSLVLTAGFLSTLVAMIAFWLSPCLVVGERPNPGVTWLFRETLSVSQFPCGVAPMDRIGPRSSRLCSQGPVGREV